MIAIGNRADLILLYSPEDEPFVKRAIQKCIHDATLGSIVVGRSYWSFEDVSQLLKKWDIRHDLIEIKAYHDIMGD